MTTLVSLVSEQTLPNVFFIRHQPSADRYVFLTTERMEQQGKTAAICRVGGVPPDRVERLEIHHDDLPAILTSLGQRFRLGDGEAVALNLTGGTKMMALAAYAFFTTNVPEGQLTVYYLPSNGQRLQRVYPTPTEPEPLNYQISTRDYLTAHGVELLETAPWQDQVEEAEAIFGQVSGLRLNPSIQSKIARSRNQDDRSLNATERQFYSGEWLEAWLASAVCARLGLDSANVLQGAKIRKIGAKSSRVNEYDVLFVRENKFYAAECKYFDGQVKSRTIDKITKEIYKMGGINNLLGLNATSFFVIVNQLSTNPDVLYDALQIARIKEPAYLPTLRDAQALKNYLLNL